MAALEEEADPVVGGRLPAGCEVNRYARIFCPSTIVVALSVTVPPEASASLAATPSSSFAARGNNAGEYGFTSRYAVADTSGPSERPATTEPRPFPSTHGGLRR